MLKPLSLSVSLAVALGACSLSFAGGHGKIFASGQCETASPQASIPSAQSVADGCGDVCAPKKSCALLNWFKHEPKPVEYEWVLKKKHNWSLFHGAKSGGCDMCGSALPSGQSASAQSYGSGQILGSHQGYSTPQAGYSVPQTASTAPVMEPPTAPAAPAAPAGDAPAPAAPPAPTTPPTASNGLQLLPSGSGN